MYLISLLTIFLISIFILNGSLKIGSLFKIIDYPNKRKLNKNKAVKIGSILFAFPIFSILILTFINQSLLNIEIISLTFIFLCLFIIGFVDDRISLSATKKIILYFIISFLFVKLNSRFEINSLNFYFFEAKDIKSIGIYFTCFCIISLIIASDLMDGINLNAGIFFLSKLLVIFFIFNDLFISKKFVLFLIIPLVVFLIYNFRGKVYLGTGGTCVLAFFLSLIFIEQANNFPNFLSATHILAILLIPGIDMIRVFLIRFFKNGKIFTPDKRHLHHLLENKFGINKTIVILSSLYISTDFISFYLYDFIYYLILFQIISFITILRVCAKNIK